MVKEKRIYALPHNDNYSLIDSYHTGGIEGEGFLSCDNCNALISRVAIIKSKNTDTKYNVGFDCAKTLTSIKKEDIDNHMVMFKLGESVRKSLLNYFKQTAVCSIQITEKDGIANIFMNTNNNFRFSFRKEFVINNEYYKYIEPQLRDLKGVFIRRKRVTEEIVNEFIYHMRVGMEMNVTGYHQRINDIDISHDKIYLDDLYMKNGRSTSTRTVLSVLGDLIYTDYFKELMLKHNLL